jgi:hypothetical protein
MKYIEKFQHYIPVICTQVHVTETKNRYIFVVLSRHTSIFGLGDNFYLVSSSLILVLPLWV